MKYAYERSNIYPLISASKVNPHILWKSPSLHFISFK